MKNDSGLEQYFGKTKATIGAYTYGVEHILIREWGEGASLDIGKFCSIADRCIFFMGGNHRSNWITTYPFGHDYLDDFGGEIYRENYALTNGNIKVGNDVWIGSNVTILSGVTIGDGAILAANSTISKNVEPYEIVGGNPARHIKFRFDAEVRKVLLEIAWWNLPKEKIKSMLNQLCSEPSLDQLIELRNGLAR